MKFSDYLKVVFSIVIYFISFSSLADNVSNGDRQPAEVACHYQTKVRSQGKAKSIPSNNDWFFWRKANIVQTRDADGDHGEIWQHLGNGGIQYRKLYHADKTAVEYMPADQPTNNMNFDWFKLSSMLTREELNDLKLIKKTKALGRNAELRKGTKADQNIEVIWLIDEELPASIIKKDPSGSVELRLIEISALSDAPRKPVDLEEIANYRHIDAVDFGDMENDPFVKKIMAAEGHHHH